MGFLPGLAQFAGNAVNPALAVVGERQRVAGEARQQALAQQVAQIKMKEEQDKQDLLRQSTQSTIGMNAAHTKLYEKQATEPKEDKIIFSQGGTPYTYKNGALSETPIGDRAASPATTSNQPPGQSKGSGTSDESPATTGSEPPGQSKGTGGSPGSPATTGNAPPGQSKGSPDSAVGNIDLRNPSAGASASPGRNQQATNPASNPSRGVPVTPTVMQPTPKFGPRQPAQSTVPGTPEWAAAQTQQAKIRAQFAQPDRTLVQIVDPTGKVVYARRPDAVGAAAPGKTGAAGALAAPMASKVGQFGEMLKKSGDLLPAMEALDVSLGQSAGADVAQHGVGVAGMHIPGTKGLGNILVNRTPEYATYQTVLTPFVLANAHALSGARINNEQAQMIRQSIEMQPSDAPQTRKQRIKNVIDQLNSVGGSLPQDAIAEQESQMDPQVLEMLRANGYKSHSGTSSKPPGAAPSGFDPDAFYAQHKKAKGVP